MFKLALVLHAMIATSLMGIGVTAVLATQMNAGWVPIALAAGAGFLIAIPVSWFVAKAILKQTQKKP